MDPRGQLDEVSAAGSFLAAVEDAMVGKQFNTDNVPEERTTQAIGASDSDYHGDIESTGDEDSGSDGEQELPARTDSRFWLHFHRNKTGTWQAWARIEEIRAPASPDIVHSDTSSSIRQAAAESRPSPKLRLRRTRKKDSAHENDPAASSEAAPSSQPKRIAEDPIHEGSMSPKKQKFSPPTPARKMSSGQTSPTRMTPARKAKTDHKLGLGANPWTQIGTTPSTNATPKANTTALLNQLVVVPEPLE